MTRPTNEGLLAQPEAATAWFRHVLPAPRAVTTTGELATILANLPADIPLLLADQVLSRPDLDERTDVVYVTVAHLAQYAETVATAHLDRVDRMLPALGLTTVRIEQGQDAGAEFASNTLQPFDRLARAEKRLVANGELEGGIQDAADALDLVAHYLHAGAELLPSRHDAHTSLQVETSRLRHTAERLRKESIRSASWRSSRS
ncbi:hypothetical protein ACH4VR_36255 [Streptomyces sp. NPDC020883]|uniref:hypothetical protein n=1 Tax=Streptomyces sp. NPDC020883 TaxID=3365099 RepID=UPI00379E678A